MADSVSWGILGCGDVTEIKSGPALAKTPRSQLHAVMRRDGGKARDYAKRHDVAKSYDTVDALLADDDVTAIYIATPPASHMELTIRALDSGRPVLVEKPMALNADECAAMADASARTGQPLMIAYYRRALPRFERLREIVQSGVIGQPRAVEVRHRLTADAGPPQAWKRDPAINGGGLFVDMHPHTLDWLNYVFGPAEHISGDAGGSKGEGGERSAETSVVFSARFPGGVVASGSCVYDTVTDADRVTIIGDAGEVSMSFFRPGPIKLRAAHDTQEDIADPPHVHGPLIERVVAHLLDGAPNPCGADDGARATAMIDQILKQRRG